LSRSSLWLVLLGILLAVLSPALPAQAQVPVVRAVIFYSPSCPHCHQVITEDLPPLLEQYGEQLLIAGVNTADPGGQALFRAAIEHFAIPEGQYGVPMLVVGDQVLIGSLEIPQRFPQLIEQYLAQGGVGWPAIPGLAEALAAAQPEPSPGPAQPTPDAGATVGPIPTAIPAPLPADTNLGLPAAETVADRLARDPVGNGLSIAVLVGMLVAVIGVAVTMRRPAPDRPAPAWKNCLVPLLTVIGLGVAGYLAYVETTQVTAICGPVGDCNTVQQSEYALLFGFLPVAVLGLVGYVAIGTAWAVGCYARGLWTRLARVALFGMAVFGTLFSIYLTFLEPFVIGATCAWCLTSAVLMTVLMLLAAGPAREILAAWHQAGWRNMFRDQGRLAFSHEQTKEQQ
jgi:uncharacterized membrane protein